MTAPRYTSVGLRAPLSWQLRRWTLRHLWYRTRLSSRRRRWLEENIRATKAYLKSESLAPAGRALLLGDFSGTHGLSRGAAYDREWLRKQHSDLTVVDIGPTLKGEPIEVDKTSVYSRVYLFCQPDAYSSFLR